MNSCDEDYDYDPEYDRSRRPPKGKYYFYFFKIFLFSGNILRFDLFVQLILCQSFLLALCLGKYYKFLSTEAILVLNFQRQTYYLKHLINKFGLTEEVSSFGRLDPRS